MYSTCLSCHAPLGANEVLERFPIGRRVAFDQARGRLWAVCAVCRQWNLAGLDERWEAIEAAERLFHDTKLRASTDNIGLARMRDGSELVRIGDPKRPEFAAWRYGERFTRRFRTRAPIAAIGTAGVLAAKLNPFVYLQFTSAMILPVVIPVAALTALGIVRNRRHRSRAITRIELPDGRRAALTEAHLEMLAIERHPDGGPGWGLRVKHSRPEWKSHTFEALDPATTFTGERAMRLATQLLPRINRIGGTRSTVADAVEVLERSGDPDAVFRLASVPHRSASRWKRIEEEWFDNPESAGTISNASAPIRLALEMAAHEEQERLLLQGELVSLEDQWREAEEVAAIADELTLPPAILRQMERLRVR
jgi:hypothetical protein